MGQSKHNPTAQLAKEGKLPPKKKPMSKKETERFLYSKAYEYLLARTLDPCLKGDKNED
jgi:hypothetical protein